MSVKHLNLNFNDINWLLILIFYLGD